ncbi:YdeI/OmpD-associated family protein [Candidatus Pacearchaeota archaeon]|nr:YdeI/OmpD-associated family protein [Candidatus Pacearchaeota archaeon]
MEIDNSIHAGTKKEWRAWLKKNHKKEKKVALISYKKHTGKPSISHREAMDEAICFGWIDTTIKRLDDERYIRHFAKRGDKSRWSSATLKYAKRLIKEGKMSPHGLKMYKEGLKKPTIDAGLPTSDNLPDYLEKELRKHGNAYENFMKFAPSYKRTYIRWIARAIQPETRKKRIDEVIKRALENRKNFL